MRRSIKILLGLTALLTISFFGYQYKIQSQLEDRNESVEKLKDQISDTLFTDNNLPEVIEFKDEKYKINYTFNEELTDYIKTLLRRYRSDYSAVVVIDNDTGNILSAVGYERKNNHFTNRLPFSVSHPSASLFKIVTTANLLEKENINKDTRFSYAGRGTTLYKYQLKKKKTKWLRYQTLAKAFAFSNNVIFGKAAIYNTTGEDIFNTALEFGFNKDIMADINLSKSIFEMPESQYNLAELASGFNKKTTISPVHGAVLSSIVANGGIFRSPRIISKISSDTKTVWTPPKEGERVISSKTSMEIKDMMNLAVQRGTARSFRRLKSDLRENLDLGGKTGSITGGLPHGKRDWFTAYAVPKGPSKGGISICVMNINVNKWYVKSTFLAKKIVSFYFKKVNPLVDLLSEKKLNKKNSGV